MGSAVHPTAVTAIERTAVAIIADHRLVGAAHPMLTAIGGARIRIIARVQGVNAPRVGIAHINAARVVVVAAELQVLTPGDRITAVFGA